MKIRNIENLNQAFTLYQAGKNGVQRWVFPNEILYQICEQYPAQNDIDQIVAKFWIIGRSYAAAVERVRGVKINGDAYYDHVAPAVIQISSALETAIHDINQSACLDETIILKIVQTHCLLEEAVFKAVSMYKRSLCSKYLHFHCRKSVPIYDSQAAWALRSLVSKDKGDLQLFSGHQIDEEYADFALRFLFLKNEIQNEYQSDLSVREMDVLLQGWYWEKHP